MKCFFSKTNGARERTGVYEIRGGGGQIGLGVFKRCEDERTGWSGQGNEKEGGTTTDGATQPKQNNKKTKLVQGKEDGEEGGVEGGGQGGDGWIEREESDSDEGGGGWSWQ